METVYSEAQSLAMGDQDKLKPQMVYRFVHRGRCGDFGVHEWGQRGYVDFALYRVTESGLVVPGSPIEFTAAAALLPHFEHGFKLSRHILERAGLL